MKTGAKGRDKEKGLILQARMKGAASPCTGLAVPHHRRSYRVGSSGGRLPLAFSSASEAASLLGLDRGSPPLRYSPL